MTRPSSSSTALVDRHSPPDQRIHPAPRPLAAPPDGVNVSHGERLASVVLGGALITFGLGRSSFGEAALAVLGGGALVHRGLTGHCQVYEALGREGGQDAPALVPPPRAEVSITIGKPAAELHEAWRHPATLARVMEHFAALSPADAGRTRWSVQGPLGTHVAWDTLVTGELPERIEWRSVEGAPMASEGWVRFRQAPGDRGTEVTLSLGFEPPGGVVGNALVRLLGAPVEVLARGALRRFKSLVETGEIPTLAHNPAARPDAPPLLSSLRIAPQAT